MLRDWPESPVPVNLLRLIERLDFIRSLKIGPDLARNVTPSVTTATTHGTWCLLVGRRRPAASSSYGEVHTQLPRTIFQQTRNTVLILVCSRICFICWAKSRHREADSGFEFARAAA